MFLITLWPFNSNFHSHWFPDGMFPIVWKQLQLMGFFASMEYLGYHKFFCQYISYTSGFRAFFFWHNVCLKNYLTIQYTHFYTIV